MSVNSREGGADLWQLKGGQFSARETGDLCGAG